MAQRMNKLYRLKHGDVKGTIGFVKGGMGLVQWTAKGTGEESDGG